MVDAVSIIEYTRAAAGPVFLYSPQLEVTVPPGAGTLQLLAYRLLAIGAIEDGEIICGTGNLPEGDARTSFHHEAADTTLRPTSGSCFRESCREACHGRTGVPRYSGTELCIESGCAVRQGDCATAGKPLDQGGLPQRRCIDVP